MSYNLGTATGRILIDGSGAQKGFGVATVAANAFYDAVSARLDSVQRLGDNLIKIGVTGSAGLGLAVKAAASFEAGLSGVKAVSGATTTEMEQLRAAALRIGKDTSFSASEAVAAISELSKAGVSTSDILNGAADATVALAAAGELDLPRAAEIASSAINNFALSGKQLPHVADLIAGAANASAIDVGDFGFSLSQAGAVANLTGLKFDDLAVAIAEMGQAGIKGSDAGTSIKTFLTNLIPTTNKQIQLFTELGLTTVRTGADFSKLAKQGIKPASNSFEDVVTALEKYNEKINGVKPGTAKAAKAAQELGSEMGIVGNAFFDAQGKMVPFKEIQDRLNVATKNLSKEQKLMALDTLFGSDAIRASAVFADRGAAGFDKMSAAIGKVKAADVAKTRLDNLNGSIEQLKGSFETAQIIIGEVFLPIVRKFVDGLNSLIGVFLNLPEPVQRAIAIFLGLGTAMSLMTGIAIKLAFALGPVLFRMLGFAALRQVFSIFTIGFQALRGGAGIMGALGAASGRLGVVFTRFARIGRILFAVLVRFPRLLMAIRAVAALAFGPWGIALAAVVAGAILAYKHFKPFHDLVNQIAKVFQGVFLSALTAVREQWAIFIDTFKTGEFGAQASVIEKFALVVRGLWGLLKDLAATFMEVVVPALREAGGEIMKSLQSAWADIVETFRANVMPALRELQAAFIALLPQLKELWVQLQPVLKFFGILALIIVGTIIVALYALIKVIILLLPLFIKLATIAIQGVINVLQLAVEVFLTFLATIIAVGTGAVNAVSGFVKGIAQLIGGLVAVFKNLIGLIINIVTGDWKGAWESAKNIFQGFKDIFVGLVRGMVSLVFNLIKGFVNGIIAFFKGLYNVLVGHSIVPDLVNAIIRLIATLPGRAAGALASLGSAIVGRITSAMNAMRNGINNGINTVVSLIRSLPGRMRSALGNLGGILFSAGQSIIRGLLNGINSMIGSVRSKLGELTGLIPDWKGPMATDKKLLTDNGIAIMKSLITAFESQMPKIQSFLAGLTKLIGDGVTVPPIWTIGNGVEDAISSGIGSVRKPGNIFKGVPVKTGKPTEFSNIKAGSAGASTTVVNNWTINNPIAEKSSVTTTREATKRATLGVLA